MSLRFLVILGVIAKQQSSQYKKRLCKEHGNDSNEYRADKIPAHDHAHHFVRRFAMPKYLRRVPQTNQTTFGSTTPKPAPSSKASIVSRLSMFLLNEHRQRTAEMAEVAARLAALEAKHQEKEARLTALEALVRRGRSKARSIRSQGI